MKRLLLTLALTYFLLPLAIAQPPGKEMPQGVVSQQQTAASPNYQILNINNITTWMRRDGWSNHSPTGNDGCYFPRGTAWVIYQDGMLWAAKAYLDAAYTIPAPNQLIRVGGQTYNVGTGAGWVIGQGATAEPVPTSDPGVRIYRIRRDFREASYEAIRRDAAEFFEVPPEQVTSSQIAQVTMQYRTDWTEWPVARGAPYIERNGIPGYQPPPHFFNSNELIANNNDEPGIAGADVSLPASQVIWTVFNDLRSFLTLGLYGSEPLGLEVQTTLWGFGRSDALGNIYFKRYRLINKGGVDIGGGAKGSFWIDSLFLGQWSDTDLGYFGDDLIGCDPSLNLAYTYNGTSLDREYSKFGIPPPALGYHFVYGPLVSGSASDSAVFDFKWIRGKKNLGMTSYSPKYSGTSWGDPPFLREGALRWWRWIQGYLPTPSTTPWRLYPFPPGMPVTKFPFSGDPVARTGFIDGLLTSYSGPPGDRRFTMSTGPIRLAPGETQEVVLATIGGLGADRLTSISALKYNVRAARAAASLLFATPSPPQQPTVKVIELNQEIVLDWGSDLQKVKQVEERVGAGGYAFEGYNVYQLPSARSPLSDGVRIATFDVVNNITNIVDDVFDPILGIVIPTVVQRGSDSGVQRYLSVRQDLLRGQYNRPPLRNGTAYYFAVTAYNYSNRPDAFPTSLESTPVIVSAKPRIPFGVALQANRGDTLAVQKTAGRSTGTVTPIVVDPLAGTNDTYEVGFDTAGGTITWNVKNISRSRTIVERQKNQSGDTDYPILEAGVLLKVFSPPPGLNSLDSLDTPDRTQWGWAWLSGTRLLTWSNGNGLGFEGFRGAVGWASPRSVLRGNPMVHSSSELKNIEIRFAPTSDNAGTFNPNHPNASYAYRYGRMFTSPPAKPEFAAWIINTSGGFSYQDYRVSVPLAVYDTDANPPRRLAVGFLENNVVAGTVNGFYWPPSFGIDNVVTNGPREWLFILDADYTGATPVPLFQADILQGENMPVMYFATWARQANFPWPEGNVMALYPSKPNGLADRFVYTVPAPLTNRELQHRSVGIFPNPYYVGQTDGAVTQGRFVTFNNLPPKATIRIFNLAGHLVRTLTKDDASQYLAWDLTNEHSYLVGSGMYLCYVEMPEVGATKILKLAVIQGDQIPLVK